MHTNSPNRLRSATRSAFLLAIVGGAACCLLGCPTPQEPGFVPTGDLTFRNTTDPTNNGASYVGAAACSACHPSFGELVMPHGHSNALTAPNGAPPVFAAEGTRAGVPDPPAGKTWNDVSFVIAGYTHGAFFVDMNGFVMTDGVESVNTGWALDFPPNGATSGFIPYKPDQAEPLAYDYDCFRCHTTGPQPQAADNPLSQEGRPGILGTWAEAGVRCEACHGPGSIHVPNPQLRNIFVDSTNDTCAKCHVDGPDANVIVARDGYVSGTAQVPELRASGGHADFTCTICHDPHASTIYDRERGIRNECSACHADQNLAFHAGVVFERGDYSEAITCESCHMTYAGLSTTTAGAAVVGEEGRMGDVRSHIFRIDAGSGDFNTMFTADGTQVVQDADGLAAVTLDFVCLRCHSGTGNAFPILADRAALIATEMHAKEATNRPAR